MEIDIMVYVKSGDVKQMTGSSGTCELNWNRQIFSPLVFRFSSALAFYNPCDLADAMGVRLKSVQQLVQGVLSDGMLFEPTTLGRAHWRLHWDDKSVLNFRVGF